MNSEGIPNVSPLFHQHIMKKYIAPAVDMIDMETSSVMEGSVGQSYVVDSQTNANAVNASERRGRDWSDYED